MDGLPAHRSRAMRAWLATQRSWLVVERLPGYAPELNPVEGLWANFRGKGGELANLAGDTLDEVIAAATRGADRVRQTPHLPYSFLRRCGVSLWQPCHSKLQTSLDGQCWRSEPAGTGSRCGGRRSRPAAEA